MGGRPQRHRARGEAKPAFGFFAVATARSRLKLAAMLTPAEAEKLIAENLTPFRREDCPLAGAHGRVLRVDLKADRDLPPFDRVTMDGYALRSAALAAGGLAEKRFHVE